MGILKEFRDFAVRGNMVDMAVGIIVGAAFGKIVSSLVADVIMPPLGVLLGGVDFRGLKVTLVPAGGDVGAVTLNYGQFVQHVVDFLIVAAAIFAVVKAINTLKRAEQAAPAAPPRQEVLLEEIRDLLRPR
jgi:large conductance mechanosensitive channel